MRMVPAVSVPDLPKAESSKPLLTRAELAAIRRTLKQVHKQLDAWTRINHTYIGGADSLLYRVGMDWPKALDEIERLWRRYGR